MLSHRPYLPFLSCGEDGDVRCFDLREDPSRPQAGLRLPVKGTTRGWSEVGGGILGEETDACQDIQYDCHVPSGGFKTGPACMHGRPWMSRRMDQGLSRGSPPRPGQHTITDARSPLSDQILSSASLTTFHHASPCPAAGPRPQCRPRQPMPPLAVCRGRGRPLCEGL